MLHSQIATTKDMALLRMSISRPREEFAVYDRLRQPHKTALCAQLKNKFGDIKALSKLFHFANEASSQLGEWCADQLWLFSLAEEESARKLVNKASRINNDEKNPVAMLDAELRRLAEAKSFVTSWNFRPLSTVDNGISPKLALLQDYLERNLTTDTRCIIFVKKRFTARLMNIFLTYSQVKQRIPDLRTGLLIGSKPGEAGDAAFSFRQQVLTLLKLRKGELNCLIATSIAEEGLDIPDCNLVIRFDLYDTLIQYIQSRGRARHANSTYIHMVEQGNRVHFQLANEVQEGEDILKAYCEALPPDRLLQGNNASLDASLEKERAFRSYTDPETKAKLTYSSSLVVLSHFVDCLPHPVDVQLQISYITTVQDRHFVCDVILPESSPVHSATGRPAAKKSTAKRSAAFEACVTLRRLGHLDSSLLPTYHKKLPEMRNAHLALNMNKSNAYTIKVKPSIWESGRGSVPEELYLTVLTFETPENLGRPCQPLAMCTRSRLPDLPKFPLHVRPDHMSQVISISLVKCLELDGGTLEMLNTFTLRVFKDIFNKTYEANESKMSYWLAPIVLGQSPNRMEADPQKLIDWTILRYVHAHEQIDWSPDMPSEQLVDRYLVDKWDGGRRLFSQRVRYDLKPRDRVPADAASHKWMDDILNYSVSLYAKSRARATWRDDQPVLQCTRLLHRLNWLDEWNEKEKAARTAAYVVPEPLGISAVSTVLKNQLSGF